MRKDLPERVAEQTALLEANARQKKALDRLMEERTALLYLLSEIWDWGDLGSDRADKVKAVLKEAGYQV